MNFEQKSMFHWRIHKITIIEKIVVCIPENSTNFLTSGESVKAVRSR